jgi:Na+/proline symporter
VIAWIFVATGIYVLANLGIGFFRFRSTTYESFASSRSSVPTPMIALSITGTVVGGGMFFAVAQIGYEAGLVVLALPVSYVLGYILLGRAIPRIKMAILESDGNTLYDVITQKLGPREPGTFVYRFLLSLVNFAMYFFMLAGQFTVLASFYQTTIGLSPSTSWAMSLGVIAGCTLVYSVIGGVRKDIATDAFQVFVVVVGLAVICSFLFIEPPARFLNVPRSHLTFTGYGVAFPIAVVLFYSPAFIARYDYWQRVIAATTEEVAKRGMWWSLPLIAFAYIVFCLVGIFARSNAPEIPASEAAVWTLRCVLPESAFIVVVLALYAGVMASADTLLNVSSLSLYQMLRDVSGAERRNRKRSLPMVRVLAVFVGFLASLMVIVAPDTVDLIVAGFSSLVILAPGVGYVVFSPHPRRWAPIMSLCLGYTVFLLLFVLLPSMRKQAFIPGVVLACLPVLGALVRKRVSTGSAI